MKKVILLLVAILINCAAFAQTHKIAAYVIGGGGGVIQNSSNVVKGTIGQPAIGIYMNNSNIAKSGFWYMLGPNNSLRSPNLLTPPNNSTNINLDPIVQWSPVLEASSYTIQVSTDPFFINLIVNFQLTSTQYGLQNLLNSTMYYWRIKAHSIDKESAWSAVWNFKTFPLPLGVPSLTSPNKNATNVDINPTLNWSSVTDATQYDVQLWKKSNNQMIVNTTVATTNHSGFTLDYSTEYEWKVRAKNSEQTGDWSETWNFTTKSEPLSTPNLSSPSNNATNQELSVTLSWQSVNNATSYIVQAATNNNFSNPILNYETSNLNYLLEQLSYSTTYFWRVKAKNSQQESNWSDVSQFTTKPEPLGIPNLTSPANQATNVALNPTLTWSSVANATHYDVQLWKKSNSQMIVNTTVSTTNHSGFTLDYSTEYEWKVRAKNSQQTGNWSSTYSFTTLPPTLPIVSTANATNIEVTTATVGGNVTGGSGTITTRGIKWGTSENNLNNTSTSGSGLGSFTINLTNLTHSTTYYYRAFATSEYGTGYGDIKSFKTKDAPPFTVTIGDKTTCKYQPIALGSDLKIDGGSGNFSYTWAPASLLDDGSKANPVFLNPTITRNFTLTVKDNVSNVSITKTISITVIETPAAAVTSYLSRKNSQPPFNLNTLVTTRTGQSPFVDKWYDVNFNELSSSIVDPPIGTTKYYHKLFDATGCSSSYKLTTIYTTSGREINEESIVNSNNYTFAASITPNPVSTSTELIVLFQQPTEVEISIIDMAGRTIYEEKFNNTSLELIHKFDFESYSPGVYLIQIKSIDDIANIKFVKY